MRQYLFGMASGESTTAVNYGPITAPVNNSAYVTTEAQVATPLPCAGTLQMLTVTLSVAPGTGKSRSFMIMKNGATTGLTVTITGTATSATITTPVLFVAGDLISMRSTPSGTPAASIASWRIQTDTAQARQAILMGGLTAAISIAANSPAFLRASGHQGSASGFGGTDAGMSFPVPCSGNITAIAAHSSVAPGAGQSYTVGYYQNGSAGPTAVLSGTNTVVTSTLTGGSIHYFAEGDTLSQSVIRSTSGATTGILTFSMVFQPDIDGRFFCGLVSGASPTVNAQSINQPYGVGRSAWTNADANVPCMPGPVTVLGFHVTTTAPGGTQNNVVQVRLNGSTTGTPAFNVVGSATGGSDYADPSTITDGMTMSAECSTSATCAVGSVHMGILMYVKPVGSGALQTLLSP